MDNYKKKIVVVGATGLIGRDLIPILVDSEYSVIVLSRNIQKANSLFNDKIHVEFWNGCDSSTLVPIINDAFAVINLAGESIAVRWTKKNKERIFRSRLDTTSSVVDAINKCTNTPKVLIQASAIGYYPHNSEIQYDETGVCGNGFLSKLVSEWEKAAEVVNDRCRLVLVRTGIVLSSKGGFLGRIIYPTRNFIGGWIGDGKQKVSWIHIDDYVNALKFLLEKENCKGPFNLVSPNPCTLKQLVKMVGKVLKRPVWLPVPRFALKALFGKMADEILCSNQKIIPRKLLMEGFIFNHCKHNEAIEDLL